MATNGIGFTCRPSRHNHLPMGLVKVPSCGTMTADALSSMAGLKPLKQVKGDRFAIARLTEVGFTP
jgi:hypothetical protein